MPIPRIQVDDAINSIAASITVTSPNGSENWASGSSHVITWTATGVSNPLTIQLSRNGSSVGRIAQGIDPSAGSYTWTVGESSAGTAPSGTGYVIRIVDKTTGFADRCDGSLEITSLSPSIIVTSLNED